MAAGDRPAFSEALQQAADWHVILHSGEATEEELRQFAAWHDDPGNASAYRELDAVWNRFDAATPAPARQALHHALEDSKKTRASRARKAGVALSGLLVLLATATATLQSQRPSTSGIALARYFSPGYLFSDYRTHLGQQRTVVLGDKTRVVLNSFSAIDVEYSAGQRRIRLLQGEIHLEVAPDPQRPLTVTSRHGSATALGTRYSLYDRGEDTAVTVTESRVEVCPSAVAGHDLCQRLDAGQTTTVGRNGVAPPRLADAGFEHDWAASQLIVDNQPLLKVLDELSRYRLGMLRIDREGLADYRVSGVFPLDDPERALAVLERSLPIEVSRYTPLLTVIVEK